MTERNTAALEAHRRRAENARRIGILIGLLLALAGAVVRCWPW